MARLNLFEVLALIVMALGFVLMLGSLWLHTRRRSGGDAGEPG